MTINPNDLANMAKLTFADDFNSLNLWNGQSGTWNTGDSWGNAKGFSLSGNGEQEWYINSQYGPTESIKPWSVTDGVLNITAQPATEATKQAIGEDYQYTSGQINTFHSFSQTYGYFEMRAELPAGQGLWPAFWLLPEDNSWPPEIDVMENLGNNMNRYYTTVHTAETGAHTQNSTAVDTPDLSTGFHSYGVDWEADKITWYIDGKQVFQTDTPSDMNKPAYMVANLAVGGYWPGNADPSTPFPATMKIDYIHAYSAKPDGGSGGSMTLTQPASETAAPDDALQQTTLPDQPHAPDAGAAAGSSVTSDVANPAAEHAASTSSVPTDQPNPAVSTGQMALLAPQSTTGPDAGTMSSSVSVLTEAPFNQAFTTSAPAAASSVAASAQMNATVFTAQSGSEPSADHFDFSSLARHGASSHQDGHHHQSHAANRHVETNSCDHLWTGHDATLQSALGGDVVQAKLSAAPAAMHDSSNDSGLADSFTHLGVACQPIHTQLGCHWI